MPARYMGETNLSPPVYGGRFDTMGHAPMPEIPDLPGEAEYRARVKAKTDALGPRASWDEVHSTMRSMVNEAPSLRDYGEHMSKPETKEIVKERKRIGAQNARKQMRAAAMRRGENVNFRRDRLAGDPKITA